MGFKGLASEIREKIKKGPIEYQWYADYFEIVGSYLEDDRAYAVEGLRWLSERIIRDVDAVVKGGDSDTGGKLMELHKQVLLRIARWDFDSFLLYVEWNREPSKQFYYPRRKQLRPVVQTIQDLADDKLDIAGISLPPGVGNRLWRCSACAGLRGGIQGCRS